MGCAGCSIMEEWGSLHVRDGVHDEVELSLDLKWKLSQQKSCSVNFEVWNTGNRGTKCESFKWHRPSFSSHPKNENNEAEFHVPSPDIDFPYIKPHPLWSHLANSRRRMVICLPGTNAIFGKCSPACLLHCLSHCLSYPTTTETPVISHFAMEATTPHLNLEVKAFRRARV